MKSNLIKILNCIKNETRPIEGHTDPGAIQDCWNEVFESLENADKQIIFNFEEDHIDADCAIFALYAGLRMYYEQKNSQPIEEGKFSIPACSAYGMLEQIKEEFPDDYIKCMLEYDKVYGKEDEKPNQRLSDLGDLKGFAKEVEKLFSERFCKGERPSIAIAFTLPPEYCMVHYVTNVSRENGILLLQRTAEKMISQTN